MAIIKGLKEKEKRAILAQLTCLDSRLGEKNYD
jgi:hypothetical protein